LACEKQVNGLSGKDHLLYTILLAEYIDVKLENDKRDQNPSDWIPKSHYQAWTYPVLVDIPTKVQSDLKRCLWIFDDCIPGTRGFVGLDR